MNRFIFLPLRNQQKILRISHKNYNGLCERPTQSVISHLHILWTMDTIINFNSILDISWSSSIILTSSAIRLLQIPMHWLIRDIKWYLPRFMKNFVSNWYEKLVMNDFEKDCIKHRLKRYEKENYLKYYDFNYNLTWGYQIFVLFNNFRALNSMSKGSEFYKGFEADSFLGYTINLALYDSNFVFPFIIFGCNYLFIKCSNHPWFINYNHLNHRKLIYFTFSLSLFSVFWPKCYCVSWIGYTATHLMIIFVRNMWNNRNKWKNDYNLYIDKFHLKKIKNLYDKKI